MEHNIREEMSVLPSIDPQFEIERRVAFIKRKLTEARCISLVLGISGGVDSTTRGRLDQLAVEELNQQHNTTEYQFIVVRLPNGEQKMKMKRNSHSPLFAQLTRFPSTSKPESMVCMPPHTTHWRIPDLSQAIRLRLISSKAT